MLTLLKKQKKQKKVLYVDFFFNIPQLSCKKHNHITAKDFEDICLFYNIIFQSIVYKNFIFGDSDHREKLRQQHYCKIEFNWNQFETKKFIHRTNPLLIVISVLIQRIDINEQLSGFILRFVLDCKHYVILMSILVGEYEKNKNMNKSIKNETDCILKVIFDNTFSSITRYFKMVVILIIFTRFFFTKKLEWNRELFSKPPSTLIWFLYVFLEKNCNNTLYKFNFDFFIKKNSTSLKIKLFLCSNASFLKEIINAKIIQKDSNNFSKLNNFSCFVWKK
ncbi:hypothetical protein RFI_27481 [Reticulomyxa filosa]|uniref:Uncharacterized protein n=1 Tax=Reticulomyxa filosa TaxID=46433 RepID=X6M7F3_RETFI|nr:hypothetical protein RFI_27481 [Reticulomyxa filosa]|eukprot:ETO09898.1 hypothetical protein RFI_27481 [Reticulomyxa filosa]